MRYNPTIKAHGLADYMRRKAAALDWYNDNVVAVWNAYGRPSTSEECRWKLRGVWDAYVMMLNEAGHAYDLDLELAEYYEATVKPMFQRIWPTGVEMSQQGLA